MMILLPGSGPLHAILHSIAYAPASAMKPEDRGATASLLATTRYEKFEMTIRSWVWGYDGAIGVHCTPPITAIFSQEKLYSKNPNSAATGIHHQA